MNMKQTKNKLMATMITMLLFASVMLAVVPTANAFLNSGPEVHDSTGKIISGNVGDIVHVLGESSMKDADISIYWESRDGLLLGSGRTDVVDGTFNITVTIPPAAKGDYNILAVEELSGQQGGASGDSQSTPFAIEPKITLTPDEGIIGTVVTVTGTGFMANSQNVTIVFDTANVNGSGPVTVKKDVPTDANGGFTTTFNVPNVKYATYDVDATDTAANKANADFIVDAVITLDKDEGPSGTVVTINGEGFQSGLEVGAITISSDNVPMPRVDANANVNVAADGTFSIKVIVPSNASATYPHVFGVLPISVTVGASSTLKTVTADFNWTSPTVVAVVGQDVAQAGNTITVKGGNFTHITGTRANLRLLQDGNTIYQFGGSGVIDADGSFTMDVTIGTGITAGLYDLSAVDDYGLNATIPFAIAATSITLTPDSAVSGQVINVKVTGFDIFMQAGSAATGYITIDDIIVSPMNANALSTNYTLSQLAAGVDVVVPTLPKADNYEVKVITDLAGLNAIGSLKVTDVTRVTLTPTTAERGTTVTINGYNFGRNTQIATIDIFFPNGTKAVTLTVNPIPASGNFSTTWTVPNNYPYGLYTVDVIDNSQPNKLYADATLLLSEFDAIVATGSDTYYQNGDATFLVYATTQQKGLISLFSPDGNVSQTFTFTTADWYLTSTGYYKLTDIIFSIPQDAALGDWTWQADFALPSGINFNRDGVFAVKPEGDKYLGVDTDKIVNDIKDAVEDAISNSNIGSGGSGTQGEKGDTGPQGPAGSSGSAGAKGDKGDKGDTGAKGDTGDTGPQGEDTSSGWSQTALALAVVALVVGAVAAFLAITLRRKIAN